MKIIASPSTVAAIERYFKYLVPPESFDDLVIVIAEFVEGNGYYSDLHGIDQVKRYADDPKLFVVLMSFLNAEAIAERGPEFAGLLSYANVAFARLPDVGEAVRVYRELKSGSKKEDALGKRLFEIENIDRTVSILRHDLHYAEENAKKMQSWLTQAREAGFSGSPQEIVAAVRNWKRATAGKCEGQYFGGLFVDFQGTLVKDGVVQKAVLEKVRRLAAGRSITVITDSDLQEVRKTLAGLGLPVASKFDLKGAELETVVDDLSQKEFRATYGIVPRQFIRVDAL